MVYAMSWSRVSKPFSPSDVFGGPDGWYWEKLKSRFLEYTKEAPNGCLEWIGSCGEVRGGNKKGYGRMSFKRADGVFRQANAHRLVWVLAGGSIEGGQIIMHKCDNPCCVNYQHLEIGTDAQNRRDAIRRGKAAIHEKMPRAKLNWTDVGEIRERYAKGGVSMKALSEDYGVTTMAIFDVVHKNTWNESRGPKIHSSDW